MANQNFRVKNGLEVGSVEVVNSSGSVNTSSFPDSGVSAGTVGNTTTIPVVTVNAKGLVTNIQSASVSGVDNFTYTGSNTTFVLSTGDGSTYAQTLPSANSTVSGLVKVGDLVSVNSSGFINVLESSIDHDNLSNFVSNEHIDHSSVSLTAGNGLSGGGDITSSRSFAVVAGNTQVVSNSSGIFINESNIDIHNLSGYVANENIDHSSVSVTAGDGLSGGGTIAATRTIDVVGNTGITANSLGVFTNDSEIVHDNLSGFVANEHIDHSSVSVTAGNGLSGGGTIAATRTVAVKANTGITANSSGVFSDDSAIVHDNLSGFVANDHIDHSSVSISPGNGLSGGGDLTSTRSLTVVGNTGLVSNSSGVHVAAGDGLTANSTDLKVTAGTGVTVNATGVHIGQDVSTTADVTFSDVIVSGNLTIQGTQTTVDTNNLVVNDAVITVASGQTGVPALDAGIEVERGDSANALLVWDESQDRWIQKLAGGTEYVLHTKQHDIALGTDTSGNYIDDVSAGSGIAVTHTPGEGSDPSIAVKANTGITANSSGTFTNDGQIVHDNLSGFVANEHIDHSSVSISAGNGLSGGGTIASNRTLSINAQTGVVANSSGLFADASNIDHDSLSGFVANEHIDHSSVSVTAGNGLTGGGNITASRSFAVVGGTGLVSNSTGVHVDLSELTDMTEDVTNSEDELIILDNGADRRKLISEIPLSAFNNDAGFDVGNSSITDVVAGSGLTGGGSTGTVTITAGAGNGITVNNTTVAVNGGSGITSNSTGVHVEPGNNQVVSNSTGVFINEGNIDIHNLSGYVANENIDHSGVTLTAGNGLTGGGTIAASRSFAVDAGDGVVVNATGVHVAAGNGLDVNSTALSINSSTIRGLFSGGGDISYDSGTGQFSFTNDAGDIESVVAGNGLTGGGTTGDVTLNLGVGAGLSVNTAAVSVVPNTGITANSTGIFTDDSAIVHDNLSGFAANEHINHSSVSLTAGNGLTGGGDITASRSFAVTAGLGIASNSTGVHVVAGTGITSNSTGVYADASGIDHDSLSNFVANEHINHSSVTLSAGNGLTGGGNITTSRSFAVGAGNGISVNSTAVAVSAGSGIASNATGVHVVAGNNQVVSNSTGIFVNESNLDIHNLSGYVANENIDHSSVSISAGNGLSGGGTIAANRTLAVAAGNNQVVSNSSGVFIAEGNIDIHNLSGYVANENIDHSSVTIAAGNGLSGGGTIAASRTLAVAAGNSQVVSNSSGVFIAEGNIDIHNLSGYVANENINHSTVSITAGSGLTGGGTIASTRTLTVGAGNGIVTNATAVSVGAGNGLSVNSSAVAVKANNGITSNSTGTFVRAGTGVTVNATGVHIGQSVGTTDDVTFNDVNVSGNLTISGTETTVSTATLSVTDAIITVAKDQTGVPSVDAGLEVERGDSANALFFWDESADRWTHKLAGGTEYAFHTKANDIALGTDTSGNYVDNVTGGNGIAVTGSAGEGWEPAVAVVANTGITANSSGVFTNDSQIEHDSLSGFVANEHINHTSITLTAGDGLTGGGNIAASRSFAVVGGTGVTSNSSGVHIGQDVATGASVSFNDITIAANAVIEDLYDSSNRLFKVYDSGGSVVWG